MMSVSDRLSVFIKSINILQKDLSDLFGVTPQSISGIFKGKSELTTTQIIIIANNYKQLNLRWLLIGEGEMLISSEIDKTISSETKIQNSIIGPCNKCEVLQAKLDGANELINLQKEMIEVLRGEPKKEILPKTG